MNAAAIQKKVDEAIALDRLIAQKTDELKELKAELVELAKDKDLIREKTECGGWTVVLHGDDGQIARVTKPGNKLKAGIDAESKEWGELAKLLGGLKVILFSTEVTKIPAKSIRENILALGNEKQKRIIKLITSKSSATVNFETKEAS